MKGFFLLLVNVLLSGSLFAQANSYPGRAIYPMVNVYDTQKLNQSYHEVIIVDVRSPFEFDTLHINKAVNIPLNSRQFGKLIKALHEDGKPIVFYCNGHRCFHSYKAVIKSRKVGINNVFSYDSGIFDWSKAYPEKATLLGITPVNAGQIISKEGLQEHLLAPAEFALKINTKSVILDIREPVQRGLLELYPYRQVNISLSEKAKLVKFLEKYKASDNTLFIYDEGGTQVRWLQYYLINIGVTNYFFMEGGVKKFFKDSKN